MNGKRLTLLLSCAALLTLQSAIYSQQVTLQPWTQVYGTVPGERLGDVVTGIKPTANLPYKAAVSHGGLTSFYRLQSPTDTSAQLTIVGTNLLLGDLNNDGWTDAVVAKTINRFDTVMIYWGTSIGIGTIAPTRLTDSISGDDFGHAICIGNIIGDTIPDLIITAPSFAKYQGKVCIYQGGTSFPETPTLTINGDSAEHTFGRACAIGDLNNDGYNDLVVRGALEYGADTDRFSFVDVFYGGSPFDTSRDMRLQGPETTPIEGLACFDVNGDGMADLLWTRSDTVARATKIEVHYGRSGFRSTADLVLKNPGVGDFGNVICNAGDMNGDGYNDIAIAAYRANITSGFVFIFCGGPRIDSVFDAAVGMSLYSSFGYSIDGIGDVNGDGLSDIIVGAPEYEFANDKGYWGIFLGDSSIKVTDVKENTYLPKLFTLYQCYPNPFNPTTTITYDLKQSAMVTLEITNILGQEVATLVDETQSAGYKSAVFNAANLPSGVYFYRLQAGSYTDVKKMVIMR